MVNELDTKMKIYIFLGVFDDALSNGYEKHLTPGRYSGQKIGPLKKTAFLSSEMHHLDRLFTPKCLKFEIYYTFENLDFRQNYN